MKNLFLTIALALAGLTASAEKTTTVAVFAINDFHCGMVQDLHKDTPGAAWVVQTLDSLKAVYPNHLTISSGDNFGGSFFYTATRHESLMPQMFRDMDITYSVPGNHAFDEGQELWADGWQSTPFCPRDWRLQYVCANMRREPATPSGQAAIPDGCQPWVVIPVQLKEGGTVNVSVIGLMTSNTPKQASARRLKGLTFDGRYGAVLDSLKALPGYDAVRQAGVHILATHIGTYMDGDTPAYDDPDAAELMAFDRDDIDGIFSAHSHVEVCGTIPSRRPYPIVQGYCRGKFVSMLLCEVGLESGRCLSVTPRLVRVNPHAPLSPKTARLQAQIMEQYQTATFRGLPICQRLTHAAADMPHNRSNNKGQTRMGTLVTLSYAEAYRLAPEAKGCTMPIVGVSHFGSIRGGFYGGDITVLDVGESLPFANALKVYRYTGKQLRSLMEFGINGCKLGCIQTSGVSVEFDKKGHVKTMRYTAPDGSVTPIKDTTPLILVADDYMTTGGDGYDPAFFPTAGLLPATLPVSTDAFINYLKSQPEI